MLINSFDQRYSGQFPLPLIFLLVISSIKEINHDIREGKLKAEKTGEMLDSIYDVSGVSLKRTQDAQSQMENLTIVIEQIGRATDDVASSSEHLIEASNIV